MRSQRHDHVLIAARCVPRLLLRQVGSSHVAPFLLLSPDRNNRDLRTPLRKTILDIAANKMAKVSSSARTPRRQKSATPQPAPTETASVQGTRSKRSQSRDVDEPVTPARRSQRNIKGASVESDVSVTAKSRGYKAAGAVAVNGMCLRVLY